MKLPFLRQVKHIKPPKTTILRWLAEYLEVYCPKKHHTTIGMTPKKYEIYIGILTIGSVFSYNSNKKEYKLIVAWYNYG